MVAVDSKIDGTNKQIVGELLTKEVTHIPLEVAELLARLEKTNNHRMTDERKNWLINWIIGVSQDQMAPLMEFVEKLWGCGNFWPFLDVPTSAQRIVQFGYEKIVRLSSTMPGYLTVTFITEEGIRHTRYRFDNNGNGENKTIRNIDDLRFILCMEHGGTETLAQYVKV